MMRERIVSRIRRDYRSITLLTPPSHDTALNTASSSVLAIIRIIIFVLMFVLFLGGD